MDAKGYYNQVVTAWKLFKTHMGKPYSAEYWNEYADALEDPEVRALTETRFGMDLLHLMTKELERIKREETNHGNKTNKDHTD